MNQNVYEKIAQDLFKQWNDLLQTQNKEQVAAMYSDDATFLPTLNGEFKKGTEGAAEYFEHFLAKNPYGKIVNSAVQASADGDTLIYSGLYDFEVDGTEGRDVVHARFTFIFQKDITDVYRIIHHHSSLRPQ